MSKSNVNTVRNHISSLARLGAARGFTITFLVLLIVWLVVWFTGYFQETTRNKEVLAVFGVLLGMFFVISTYLMMQVMGNIINTTQALDELLEERDRSKRLTALLTDVTYTALTQEGKEAKDIMLTTIIYRITECGLGQTDVGEDKVYYDFLWGQQAPIRKLVVDRCQELIDSTWIGLDSYVRTKDSVRPMSTSTIHGFTAEIDRLKGVIGLLQSSDKRQQDTLIQTSL